MAKYIELIDKYRIVQSEDTDYNPPSYDWVDNTGEIVRCKDCEYYTAEERWCRRLGLCGAFDQNDYCSHAERKDDEVG